MGLVGRAPWVFVAVVLVGAACSGKSIRHGDGSGDDGSNDDGSDDDLTTGGSVSSGGAAGSSTGGVVSRGGAVSRGGDAGTGGDAGDGPGGTSGTTGGTGGRDCGENSEPDDYWGDGECWIDGECRVELEDSECPATYEEVTPARPASDDVACAGPTTEGFVSIRQSYGSRLCAYDPEGNLVGSLFEDDNDEHCGTHHAFEVVAGTLPDHFDFTDFDFDGGCYFPSPPFGSWSVSSIFNDVFPGMVSGVDDCIPATDDCRSRIAMLVCHDDGDFAYCGRCASDEGCRVEYPYFQPESIACDDGRCVLDTGKPVGACTEGQAAPECRTRAATYVCDLGTCSTCGANVECALATDGALSTCADDGSCVVD